MELQARQAVLSQEAEYRRLARHLHDGISQLLAALSMQLHLAKDLPHPDSRPYLEQSLAIAQQAIEQVREMSLDLFPSMLDDFGLPDTLRYYLNRRSRRTGLAVHLVASSAWTPMPREIEAVCFRVAQEALVNAIRHASAGHVQVELRQDPDAVYLTIRVVFCITGRTRICLTFEIRSTKSERNSKFEYERLETRPALTSRFASCVWQIRISALEFLSNFGFEFSDFGLCCDPLAV